MAVLGVGGRLVLQREAPESLVLSPEVHHHASDSLSVSGVEYLSGDKVTLLSDRGLPFLNAAGVPQCPDGFASYYGSRWYLGENRDHITADTDKFYANDADDFYAKAPTLTQWSGYIYRDQLNRLSFYDDHGDALNGKLPNRLALGDVDWGTLLLAPSSSSPNYMSALFKCAGDIGEYRFSDGQDTVTLVSICADAPTYQKPAAGTTEYDDADIRPRERLADAIDPLWQVVCDLREWNLDLQAASIDTSVVGEKFGEAVKSLVTGGGTLDFLVERRMEDEQHADSTVLLHLLLMTEQGCKANAQFWMIDDRPESCGLLPGDLYYETPILVTNIAINLRPTEVVAGTATFVTTGEISLKMGPN